MRGRPRRVAPWLVVAVAAGCAPDPSPKAVAPSADERRASEMEAAREGLARLEREQGELQAKLDALERELRGSRSSIDAPDARPAAKAADISRPTPNAGVRCTVQAADNKVDIFILSAGEHDGAQVGAEAVVSRDGKTVATLVIDKVFPHYSSGSVKPGTRAEPVLAGDECVCRTSNALPR